VAEVLGSRAVVLLPDAERHLLLKGDSAGIGTLEAKEMSVAQWVFEHLQNAGRGTATLPAVGGTYVPLKASRGAAGVLGVFPDGQDGALPAEQRQMVEAFASQTALAVERAALADEAMAAWERVEAEFLRNTLLSGVSHDLRTPLAAITGAVSSLTETGDSLPPPARADMLQTIHTEAERMERLINNLLDMTRLEAGGLVLKKEWQPLQEVVGSALRQLDRRLRGREVTVDLPRGLPLVRIDAVAVEQVLVNLIDNALEYTPASSPLEITGRDGDGGELVVDVADRGPGLPAGAEKRVFEKFFRAPVDGGGPRRGIGLGLAISRGIVEAHGGKICASNRPGGGAVFRFTLPRDGTPPVLDDSG
jgi:two-component system sensor histidine kinase KdpD